MFQKIYDCFTFFNELDILEIRLKYLFNKVDYFVIVESDKTHSGLPKPLFFEENKERFAPFLNKIIHIKHHLQVGNSSFETADRYNPKDVFWKLENEQRNAISKGIANAGRYDLIMVGDVDEIPSISAINKSRLRLLKYHTLTFQQIFHMYYLNVRLQGKLQLWKETVISFKNRIFSPQQLREDRFMNTCIENGGWHFSYLGGTEAIIKKLESFAHSEYNKPQYKNSEYLKHQIISGNDIFKRTDHITEKVHSFDSKTYPESLTKILSEYSKHFI